MSSENITVEFLAGAQPEHRILRLTGPLNLVTVPDFLEQVRKETAPAMIVDFSGVRMIDSAGVGSLIQIYMSLQKSKRKLALVGLNQRTKSVLELTRVGNFLPIYETAEEAESCL